MVVPFKSIIQSQNFSKENNLNLKAIPWLPYTPESSTHICVSTTYTHSNIHKLLFPGVPINQIISSTFPPPALCMLSLQSCLTLCDPKNYSPPGSSVHGILQARILEWIAMSSSQGSSWPRDLLTSPALAGGFFTTSAIPLYWEPKTLYYTYTNKSWEFCFAKHNRFAHTWNEMTVGMLLATFQFHNFKNLMCLAREGNGNPLQYSCLENPMDGGAW